MKNKIITYIIFALINVSAVAADSDMQNRYYEVIAIARAECASISGDLRSVLSAMGLATGLSVGGTVSAGIATATGIAKVRTDDEIKAEVDSIIKMHEAEFAVALQRGEVSQSLETLTASIKNSGEIKELDKLARTSQTLGNVRTIGNSVAAGTNIAGTIVSAKQNGNLNDIANQMDKCLAVVKELKQQRIEFMGKQENKAIFEKLSRIIEKCDRMNSSVLKNIQGKIKGNTIASAVGIATGIGGAVTSGIAVSKEKDGEMGADDVVGTKNLNTAANILSGATALASIVGVGFGASSMSALAKQADIINSCAQEF
ncbi:MAG: hypothetical protein LBF28_02330 [Rickettsiales bacterium]|jgi:hypothetical protein|nr:hypothetical protein [Rickettsiales bacterium]